jgi:POT family proton-dependent oligopeptide transporter
MNPPKVIDASSGVDSPDTRFFGHPRGLATLFFTEMWERFSYYGMRAFLILYMTTPAAAGGLAFPDTSAASIYGTYTGAAWGASIVGGLVADSFLGQYRSVLLGGIIIMLGHFTLVFTPLPFFYSGLALIVIGTGLLKPSVSTLVGSLYEQGDARRDAGFSIFYMGINLGAVLGPLVAGYLAQRVDWHIGFGCAGVGMLFGLVQYVLGKKHLQAAFDRIAVQPKQSAPAAAYAAPPTGGMLGFTAAEWKRIAVIVILIGAATLFWAGYEQAGSTLNLFAERYTRLDVMGFGFPSSWFQSVQPFFVIVLAPVFSWMWIRLGPREPSVGMMPAGVLAQSGEGVRVSPWWLVAAYFLSELAELSISPVGLSAVTKLAPARIVGLMMGVWFLALAFGNKLAGWIAGFISSVPLETLFQAVGGALIAATVVMLFLVKPIRRMIGGAR